MRVQVLIRSFLVLAITVIALTASAPTATAAPQTDIWTHYYDCNLYIVGEKFRGCDSTGYNWGQLSGYYKEIESCSCEGTTCTSSWYIWNGTSWVRLADMPSPGC